MNEIALVTGASGGLGREITLRLIHEGVTVVAHHYKSDMGFIDNIEGYGEKMLPMRADLRSNAAVLSMVEAIGEKFGYLNYIVNAAAISKDALLVKCSEADWDEVMALNLTAPFLVVKAALPLMIRAGKGHVINISSAAGMRGARGQCAYSASKAALHGLTRSLARELAHYGICVNTVTPGYMDTPMGRTNPEALNRAIDESMLGSLASPAEAAGLVCYLLRTSRITGQIFYADSRPI